MKKELLLMGGSHLAYLCSHLKSCEMQQRLSDGWELKTVTCSELDFILGLRLSPNGDLDCRGNEPLVKACLEAYGEPYIRVRPDRLIGLCMASWHHAVDDPIWLTRHPADLSPGFDQRLPLSTYEVVERVLPEVAVRVELVKRLLASPHRFFIISVPPAPFFHEGAVKGIPPATVRYIHWLCLMLYQAALERLGVPYLDNSVEDMEPNGFLRLDLAHSFGNCHARLEQYGALQWPRLLDFLARHYPPA